MTARLLPATAAVVGLLCAPPAAAEWEISRSLSPIDDSEQVSISKFAQDSYRDRAGQEIHPSLHVTCTEGYLGFYVYTGLYMGRDEVPVTHRWDKQEAEVTYWKISNTGLSIFVPWEWQWLEEVYKKKYRKMTVRFTPFRDNSRTVFFDLNGMHDLIPQVAEPCGGL
ncbi:MAG: hypothetical protein MI806_25930 [Minwuiales bacterium]|nr:hypothetical protein [Minwuiales bacterium]